ncbi:MAG: Ig-like domain-containing protein [Planctomycetota bacterium]
MGRTSLRSVLLAALAGSLAACSGGGGGDDGPPPPPAASVPMPLMTSPANGETGVPVDAILMAVFDQDLNSSTIHSGSVTLRAGDGTPVDGTVLSNSNAIEFAPFDLLEEGTLYSLQLSGEIRGVQGLPIDPLLVSFETVDQAAPTVEETLPADGAIDVARTIDPSVRFDSALDGATIGAASVSLSGPEGLVPGTPDHDATTNTVIFRPDEDLASGSAYTLTLAPTIAGANGTPIEALSVSFTTESAPRPVVVSTDPADGATGVALDVRPSVTFDLDLDPATVSQLSVDLTGPSGGELGDAFYDVASRRVRFVPSASELESGGLYTLSLSSDIVGQNGTAIEPFTLSFRTVSIKPQVVSTTPLNGATGQPLGVAVSVTFDAELDGATVNAGSVLFQGPGASQSGPPTYDPATFTIRYDHGGLEPGSTYTLSLSDQIRGASGARIDPFTLTFSTVLRPTIVQTLPSDGSIDVQREGLVCQVLFDRAMDASSIESAGAIKLMRAGSQVPANVRLGANGTTAELEPLVALDMLGGYRLRIGPGVRAADGVTLGSAATFDFETADGAWDSSSVLIAPGQAGSDAKPDIALSASGEATAVFLDHGIGGFVSGARYDPASAMPWLAPEALDDHSSIEGLQVETDDAGRAIAAWRFGSEIRINVYDNGWQTASQLISQGNPATGDPVLAMNGSGQAIVAWPREDASFDGSDYDVAFFRLDASGNSGTTGRVNGSALQDPVQDLVLDIDDAGATVIAFTRRLATPGQGEPYRIHAAFTQAFLGAFSPPFTIDNGQLSRDDAVDLTLAVSGGVALAAWVQDSQSCAGCNDWRNRLWANRLDLTIGGWDGPELIDDPNGGNSLKPAASLTPDGSAGMVVWRQEAGVLLREHVGTHAIDTSSILPNGLGNALLLVVDQRPLDLQIALDRGGNGLLVYRTESVPGTFNVVAHRYVQSRDEWSMPGTVESIAASAERPRLSVAATGEAMAIWYAYSSGSPARIEATQFR